MKNTYSHNIAAIVDAIGAETSGEWVDELSGTPPWEKGVLKATGKFIPTAHAAAVLDGQQLSSEIAFLTQQGFFLPLVIGGGIGYDAIPGSQPPKVDGLRVTPPWLMKQVEKTAIENQFYMAETLEAKCVNGAVAIHPSNIFAQPTGVLLNESGEPVNMGYCGDVKAINTKPIIQAILDGKVPVISHIGQYNGEWYNINATTVSTHLAHNLLGKKLVIVGDNALHNKDGEVISTVNSPEYFHQLVADGTITAGAAQTGKDILALKKASHTTVQMTALQQYEGTQSTGLLEEILGHGSGTMFDWVDPEDNGYVITTYPVGAINPDQFMELINKSFATLGKIVDPHYLENVMDKDPSIYLPHKGEGVTVTYDMGGFEYMCKFAVTPEHAGNGIGGAMLDHVKLLHPKLAWRSSPTNPFLDKYQEQVVAEGGFVEAANGYVIFGLGFNDQVEKAYAVHKIAALPSTVYEIE